MISYCTPRNKKKWVFGNKKIFKDNTKYLFIYMQEQHPEIQTIWITSSIVGQTSHEHCLTVHIISIALKDYIIH